MSAKEHSWHDLEGMRALAASKGGECLSEEFHSVGKPMRWRCALSHEWVAAPKTILYGYHDSWCPVCAGARRSRTIRAKRLELMRSIAAGHGGECLSDEYVSNTSPLSWICSAGHRWTAKPLAVCQNGRWCPVCSAEARRRGKAGGKP